VYESSLLRSVIALKALSSSILQYAIPLVFASMKRKIWAIQNLGQWHCLLCLTLNGYIYIFSNRTQVPVRKIFYRSSQNNVPNWIDRFQTFAFAGLLLLIGSKLISLNCKNSPPSADQTVCNLTLLFAKNR
jgi:hypothetical protein